MNGLRLLVLCFTSLLPALGSAGTIVFDFEELPIGQQFGGPVGDMPGDVILTQPGAELSIEILEDGFPGFLFGTSVVSGIGDTPKSLELNSVSLEVTLADMARHVRLDVVEVLPRSQFVTVQINEGDLLVEGDAFAFDAVTSDGFLVESSFNRLPSITSAAIDIVATGDQSIETVRLGAILLYVDTVTAFVVPEPTSRMALVGAYASLAIIRRR